MEAAVFMLEESHQSETGATDRDLEKDMGPESETEGGIPHPGGAYL